jgi:multicomponent Na+:H+ antiporter subunit B
MNTAARKIFFLLSAAALGWTFFLCYRLLPGVGFVQSQYGDTVNAITVPERHITDAVTAVNFDIRGFDTLGEEFILFTSILGTLLLMRRQPDEPAGDHEDQAAKRLIPKASDAVRITSLLLIAPIILFGIYIVTHGQISPGGGFQGGVILASAPLLLYLCAEYRAFRRVVSSHLVEVSEAIGAAGYIIVGAIGLAAGGLFLQNVLPLDQSGSITSGGIVVLIDLAVGLEVAGGLSLAILVYLEELLEEKEQ